MKSNFLVLFCLLSKIIFSQEFTDLKGDYLGQTPPGKKAVKFAPDIIQLPDSYVVIVAFTPDGNECYFTCRIGNSHKIYYTKRIDNIWSKPVEAPFSIGKNVVLSSLSIDGNTLFFETDGIWKVERTKEGWGKPQRLPFPITSDDHIYFETANGVAYFGSVRPGEVGQKMEIWRVTLKSGHYQNVENLGPIINCTKRNLNPCVAPDESYLIYTQSDGTYEHLFISFNKGNNEWSEPKNMDRNGDNINIRFQGRPTLSPDGKYLFFDVHIPYGESQIYWVRTEIINDLKKEVFNSKVTK